MKKKGAIILTILALSVAIAIPAVVSAAGITTDRPSALLTYCQELIQGLVDGGKLAQADADTAIGALDTKAAEIESNRDKQKGLNSAGHLGGLSQAAIASIIGVSEDKIESQLADGVTIWKIASDAGKLDALKTAILDQAKKQLADLVTNGKLTQTESYTQLAELQTKVEALTADSTQSDLAFLGGHRGGHGFQNGGRGKPAADSTKTTENATQPTARSSGTSA